MSQSAPLSISTLRLSTRFHAAAMCKAVYPTITNRNSSLPLPKKVTFWLSFVWLSARLFYKQGLLSLTNPRDALHHGERAPNK